MSSDEEVLLKYKGFGAKTYEKTMLDCKRSYFFYSGIIYGAEKNISNSKRAKYFSC